ncbi:MAG: hypothetical protein J0M04_11870 [Verrucomicrobia bacterium]|nr:hypothetical protein [Verrucomicrobiota bacterium]
MIIPKLTIIVFGILLASCGGLYVREFERTVTATKVPAANACGPWKGAWKSEVNGHTGPLWCLIRPDDDQADRFHFRYRAGWGWFRFGDYDHAVEGRMDAKGTLRLRGGMELPGGLGVYHVDGAVTRSAFVAKYQSAHDRGSIILSRPEPN